MAKFKNANKHEIDTGIYAVNLVPTVESKEEFQKRKELVQFMLIDIFTRLRQIGRPRKNPGDEPYAA